MLTTIPKKADLMQQMTLATLLTVVNNFDEYRPIFFDARTPLSPDSTCLVVTYEDPAFGDWDYVPPEAQAQGMSRFLSSGQIQDLEGALEDHEEREGVRLDHMAALIAFYHETITP